jgi:glycosyltransferase involved in cell wall biosynthesis
MLGRPHRVRPVAESATTDPRVRLLFLCSPDDLEVRTEIDAAGYDHHVVAGPFPGDYARKINVGYQVTTDPLLFLAADDLLFHPGWLEAALAVLGPGIGVVGTNDLGSRRVMAGEHSTHSLVTRAYADEFGTIDQPGLVLCEEYPHEYVDDELVQTAMFRGAWAFAADSHVEHLHPNWSKAPMDALYAGQRDRMRLGHRVYQRRRHMWELPSGRK